MSEKSWKNDRADWEISIIEQEIARQRDNTGARPKKLEVMEEDMATLPTRKDITAMFNACAQDLLGQQAIQEAQFMNAVKNWRRENRQASAEPQRKAKNFVLPEPEAFVLGEKMISLGHVRDRCEELSHAVNEGTDEGRQAFAQITMAVIGIRNGQNPPEYFEPKIPTDKLLSRLKKDKLTPFKKPAND